MRLFILIKLGYQSLRGWRQAQMLVVFRAAAWTCDWSSVQEICSVPFVSTSGSAIICDLSSTWPIRPLS